MKYTKVEYFCPNCRADIDVCVAGKFCFVKNHTLVDFWELHRKSTGTELFL